MSGRWTSGKGSVEKFSQGLVSRAMMRAVLVRKFLKDVSELVVETVPLPPLVSAKIGPITHTVLLISVVTFM